MFSVDNNGQYPGSTVAGVATAPPAAPEQPYMSNQPMCPATGTDTYTGGASIVSQTPPGFVVACNDAAAHSAAGVDNAFPQFASDVGGVRDEDVANQSQVPASTTTGALNITLLLRP